MMTTMLNRFFVVLILILTAGLAGCGSSTIESALKSERFISFGDAFSDLGQAGARYTVNTTTTVAPIWAETLAAGFGKTLTTSLTASGVSYARGNARILEALDAAQGNAPSIKAQIDTFLTGNSFGANDVVLINGGYSDIIVNTMRMVDPAGVGAAFGGTLTDADALANIKQAGKDLGGQIQRLVNSGARYVVVAGVYDLSKSPWAVDIKQTNFLAQASLKFNEGLLVATSGLGNNVYYVDAANYFNLVTATPTAYGLSDGSAAVCNSIDPGNGIGIGTGKINSFLCTPSTVVSGADYTKYVFADQVYPTPVMHSLWGARAAQLLSSRW